MGGKWKFAALYRNVCYAKLSVQIKRAGNGIARRLAVLCINPGRAQGLLPKRVEVLGVRAMSDTSET